MNKNQFPIYKYLTFIIVITYVYPINPGRKIFPFIPYAMVVILYFTSLIAKYFSIEVRAFLSVPFQSRINVEISIYVIPRIYLKKQVIITVYIPLLVPEGLMI